MEKRKKRWGDRYDGYRLRSLPPMTKVENHILVNRNGSTNVFQDSFDIDAIETYIHEMRAKGLKGFGIMHVLIAAYLRTLSQRPALNRFISGQRVYAHKSVVIALTIKQEMKLESPDTVIKVEFSPEDTAEVVYQRFTDAINGFRNEPDNDFEDVVKTLAAIPRLLMKFAVWGLKTLDYFGKLPKSLVDISPFHASLYITSMGSLGIPPIIHHLYDFGNVPVFIAFGAKQKKYELNSKGEPYCRRYVDFTVTMDERICDGYYYASAFKLFKSYLKNPAQLSEAPETVVQDVE